jgi:hypothetical protein
LPIHEFFALLSNITDAPEISIKASAYWLESALLGRFVEIKGMPVKTRPNLFTVLIGPPSLTRRSTVVSYALETYKAVTGDGKCDSIIMNGSVEGIADAISTYKMPSYHGIYSEFGATLAEMRGKEWQAGVISLLSNLYSGEYWKENLSGRTKSSPVREVPSGTYFTLFGGMQKPKENNYLDKRTIRQGFVRRLMLIDSKMEDLDPAKWKPLVDFNRDDHYFALFDTIIAQYKKRVQEFEAIIKAAGLVNGREARIQAVMIPSVEQEINKLANNLYLENKAQFNNTIAGATDGEAEKLTKLCVLEAISDPNNKPVGTGNVVPILAVMQQHLDDALKFFTPYLTRYKDLLDDIATMTVERPYEDVREKRNTILRKLSPSGTSSSLLLQKLGIQKDTLRRYLPEMFESDLIFAIFVKDGGKPSRYFFASRNDAQTFQSSYKPLQAGATVTLYDSSNFNDFLSAWMPK